MRPIYIFDLDGTIALNDHRQHFVQGDEQDWDSFFEACDKDEPNWPVINTIRTLRKCGAEIWIWSGRSAAVEKKTLDWLMEHKVMDNRMHRWWKFNPDRFRMRPDGNYTPDVELKRQWLSEVETPEYRRIVAVFDDRNSVVKMWREQGIACFQVAEGDF